MLNLKLQYFGHLMQRANSLEKTLMLGKIEGRRRKGRQRIICLDGMTDSTDMSKLMFEQTQRDSKGQEAWHAVVHRVTENQKQFSDSTTAKQKLHVLKIFLYTEHKKKSTYSFSYILNWSWTAQISVKQPPTVV